jgi:catechol 2,3-dioxygenase-like lactoylglutathione lyase family enzyme
MMDAIWVRTCGRWYDLLVVIHKINPKGERDMGTSATTEPQRCRPIEPEAIVPDGFAHFVLRTSNLEEMRHWYRTVLNAEVVHDNGQLCFMTYDEEHHRLALINVPGLHAPDATSWGLAHVAYSFKTLRQLLATYVRLRNEGILPVRPINHGPTVSLYYQDPDGNAVEFQVDAFSTKAEAASYFQSAEFKENPIGVRIDPEELVRAYEAGVPEKELMRRPKGRAEQPMAPRS